MYVYIYDELLSDGRWDKLLHKIEKKLTDLGLNGKTIRLGITKNLQSALNDEIRQGAKTIITVGRDKTFSEVLSATIKNQSDDKDRLCLGMIPVAEKNSEIGRFLGINNHNEACEILLSRRIEPYRLGSLNDGFFLFKIESNLKNSVLEIDKNFIIQPTKQSSLLINNSPKESKSLCFKISEKGSESLMNFKEMIIAKQENPLLVDGDLTISTPAKITLSNKSIKIIIGKNRII